MRGWQVTLDYLGGHNGITASLDEGGRKVRVREEDMATEAEMEQRGPKPKNVGSLSKLKKAGNSTLLREEDSLFLREGTRPC